MQSQARLLGCLLPSSVGSPFVYLVHVLGLPKVLERVLDFHGRRHQEPLGDLLVGAHAPQLHK